MNNNDHLFGVGVERGDAPSHRWGFGGLAQKTFQIWRPKSVYFRLFPVLFHL